MMPSDCFFLLSPSVQASGDFLMTDLLYFLNLLCLEHLEVFHGKCLEIGPIMSNWCKLLNCFFFSTSIILKNN